MTLTHITAQLIWILSSFERYSSVYGKTQCTYVFHAPLTKNSLAKIVKVIVVDLRYNCLQSARRSIIFLFISFLLPKTFKLRIIIGSSFSSFEWLFRGSNNRKKIIEKDFEPTNGVDNSGEVLASLKLDLVVPDFVN